MFSKLSKFIPTLQQLATVALTYLCFSLALFVLVLCKDLVRDGAITVNVRYVHSQPTYTYSSSPDYYYTMPRDVHKENVFGEYINQPPVPAEESDEFVGPPETGTHKPAQAPVKPE